MAGEIVNVEQAEQWDGPSGEHWAAHQERFDRTIEPYHARLMAAAAIAAGERVLDFGCGNGRTSRDAARAAGAGGSVLAVDLSGPMLARARQLAEDEGLTTIRFEQADAQVYPFPAGATDVAMSRFGAMFFADPVAAFTNIGTALRPGGRLAILVWQPLAANEWMTAMREALAVGRDLPVLAPGTPGPFGLADTDFASSVLKSAGFADIDFAPLEEPFNLGPDAETAYRFASGMGPVRLLVADLDDTAKARALENLRAAIAAHETADGVVFASAAWVITARMP
jgi:SAM-dependent methyltransferase